jgi:hypothetical protein
MIVHEVPRVGEIEREFPQRPAVVRVSMESVLSPELNSARRQAELEAQ